MTELDGELPQIVLDILAEFGKTFEYMRKSDLNYNPARGQNIAATDPITIKGVIEVEGDKRKLTIASQGLDFVPAAGDIVVIDGQSVTVMDPIETYYSGELAAAYGLFLP